jgi:Predicted hydrolase (metallo-beta-lactamase superfamily)
MSLHCRQATFLFIIAIVICTTGCNNSKAEDATDTYMVPSHSEKGTNPPTISDYHDNKPSPTHDNLTNYDTSEETQEETSDLDNSYSNTSSETIGAENSEITLKATVLNVGQSSCAVFESDGDYMIVDAADTAHEKYVVDFLNDECVTNIEYLFFTHYDDDHIGAGDDILNNAYFTVEHVVGPDYNVGNKNNNTYNSIVQASPKIEYAIEGESFTFGKCEVEIISRSKGYSKDNDNSVAMIITDEYSNRLYIGGDSERKSEKDQIDKITSPVDVYIVNHHGSKDSSSKELLEKLNPTFAIISCGKGNSYHHPNNRVIKDLKALKFPQCEIMRTDQLNDNENFVIEFSKYGVYVNNE